MIVFNLKFENGKSDLDLLEQIYKNVHIGETVKFGKKAYKRVRPCKNKYRTYPYHFVCITDDLYNGNLMVNDAEGDYVSVSCTYKAVILK